MNIITLTDTAARVASITKENNITTVELEWGGSDDRTVTDFDLDRLGKVVSHGGDLRHGWVILEGDCLLSEGVTIPLD